MKFPRLNFRKRIEQERCEQLERFINRVIEQNEKKKQEEKEKQQRKEELKRKAHKENLKRKANSPFRHDKYKVIYNADKELSTVYINGIEMKGVQVFSYSWDADERGQIPIITLRGYGSVETQTLSEV